MLKRGSMKRIFFILFAIFIIQYANAGSFVPGNGCGGQKEIKTLSRLPSDFNGDTTNLECTFLENDSEWQAYQASRPAWEYQPLSECTKTCGGGTWTRRRRCVDKEGNELSSEDCGGGFEEQTFACNTQVCEPGLVPTEWSECSATCNGGVWTRNHECKDGEGNQIDDATCLPQVPYQETANCNTDVPCGEWSSWYDLPCITTSLTCGPSSGSDAGPKTKRLRYCEGADDCPGNNTVEEDEECQGKDVWTDPITLGDATSAEAYIPWSDCQDYLNYGYPTAFEVRRYKPSDNVDGIRMRYGDAWSEWRGTFKEGSNFETQPRLEFPQFKDNIVKVEGHHDPGVDNLGTFTFVLESGETNGPVGRAGDVSGLTQYTSEHPSGGGCRLAFLSGTEGQNTAFRVFSVNMHYVCP